MFPLGDVVRVVQGRLLRPSTDHVALVPTGVAHDSRTLQPGALFVALPGTRTDGHLHLDQAFARGACGAIVARTDRLPPDARNLVLVAEPLAALHRLAVAWRDTLTATFVAVTGSCGKTTTKDLTAHLLRGSRPTYAAPANFNTEIGVPLAILGMPRHAKVGLFELGASRPGDIAPLARLVRPDIVVLTRIGRSHLATFGGLAAVEEEKWNAVTAGPPPRLLVLGADDPRLRRRARRWRGPLVTYGLDHGTVRGQLLAPPPPLRLSIRRPAVEIECPLAGRHQATSVLAAVAVASHLELPLSTVSARLRSYVAPPHRLRPLRAPFGWVLDDSYNAAPESYRAALGALAEYNAPAACRALVFGDMLELGERSSRWHLAVLSLAVKLGVAPIFPVGDRALRAAGSLPEARDRIVLAAPGEALERVVRQRLTAAAPAIVLVKGSRALGLDRLAARLAGPPP